MNQQFNNNQNKERLALLDELVQLGIKHTPDKIVRIAKQSDGNIVFLEEGNTDAGLQHILERHSLEFADQGIEAEQIPDLIITAVIDGKIVGYQGRKKLALFMKLTLMAKPII